MACGSSPEGTLFLGAIQLLELETSVFHRNGTQSSTVVSPCRIRAEPPRPSAPLREVHRIAVVRCGYTSVEDARFFGIVSLQDAMPHSSA